MCTGLVSGGLVMVGNAVVDSNRLSCSSPGNIQRPELVPYFLAGQRTIYEYQTALFKGACQHAPACPSLAEQKLTCRRGYGEYILQPF